jgi:hypothetical protein
MSKANTGVGFVNPKRQRIPKKYLPFFFLGVY